MEVAEQSGDGCGQDELRQRHAYTGAGTSSKGQRPPHLLSHPMLHPPQQWIDIQGLHKGDDFSRYDVPMV